MSQTCALCADFAQAHNGILGPMIGPIKVSAQHGKETDTCYVHRFCALWSAEVVHDERGLLKHVGAAVRRGRTLYCTGCGRRGATVGCRVKTCAATFHLLCAQRAHCVFNTDSFFVACAAHAKQFRHEQPQHTTPFPTSAATAVNLAELQAQQQQQEQPRQQGSKAASGRRSEQDRYRRAGRPDRKRPRLDYEAASRHMQAAKLALAWLKQQGPAAGVTVEPVVDCVDIDEGEWMVKEARRLAKNTAQLAPIILTGSGGQAAVDAAVLAVRKGSSAGAGVQGPGGAAWPEMRVEVWGPDTCGFEALGGLPHVVSALREMALLPLMHPGLLKSMGVQAPRGILLYGLPGTGKTAAVRALAGECARHAPQPVSLFLRKGADCLGKFVGDAERTLRLLFQEASRLAPSIVFLDEIDALAPARSLRESTADQVHASVVSTLLSLMDGMVDRGQVLVIGATNRLDSLDPALRRPGRFDREVGFVLPDVEARADILSRVTRGWPHKPSDHLLQLVAQATHGYAGADLQALSCGAVLAATRRTAPDCLTALRPARRVVRRRVLNPISATTEAAGCGTQQQAGGPEAVAGTAMQQQHTADLLVHDSYRQGTGTDTQEPAEPGLTLGAGELSPRSVAMAHTSGGPGATTQVTTLHRAQHGAVPDVAHAHIHPDQVLLPDEVMHDAGQVVTEVENLQPPVQGVQGQRVPSTAGHTPYPSKPQAAGPGSGFLGALNSVLKELSQPHHPTPASEVPLVADHRSGSAGRGEAAQAGGEQVVHHGQCDVSESGIGLQTSPIAGAGSGEVAGGAGGRVGSPLKLQVDALMAQLNQRASSMKSPGKRKVASPVWPARPGSSGGGGGGVPAPGHVMSPKSQAPVDDGGDGAQQVQVVPSGRQAAAALHSTPFAQPARQLFPADQPVAGLPGGEAGPAGSEQYQAPVSERASGPAVDGRVQSMLKQQISALLEAAPPSSGSPRLKQPKHVPAPAGVPGSAAVQPAPLATAAVDILEKLEEEEEVFEEEEPAEVPAWIDQVQVLELDWWSALAAVPAPASRREPLAMLDLGSAPLPYVIAPLLMPMLASALAHIAACSPELLPAAVVQHLSTTQPPPASPVPAHGASAVRYGPGGGSTAAVGQGGDGWDVLEELLQRQGCIQQPSASPGDNAGPQEQGPEQEGGVVGAGKDEVAGRQAGVQAMDVDGHPGTAGKHTGSGAAGETNTPVPRDAAPSRASRDTGVQNPRGALGPTQSLPCNLLLCGTEAQDLEQICKALLAALPEGTQVANLSLPSMVLQGEGDAELGCSRAMTEVQVRAAAGSGGGRSGRQATQAPVVIYMPCLELWAVEVVTSVPGQVTQPATKCEVTHLWNTLLATTTQASMRRPVLLLATSSLPAAHLPSSLLDVFSSSELSNNHNTSTITGMHQPNSQHVTQQRIQATPFKCDLGLVVTHQPPDKQLLGRCIQRVAKDMADVCVMPLFHQLLLTQVLQDWSSTEEGGGGSGGSARRGPARTCKGSRDYRRMSRDGLETRKETGGSGSEASPGNSPSKRPPSAGLPNPQSNPAPEAAVAPSSPADIPWTPAEQQQAVKLRGQIKVFIRSLAHRLLTDDRLLRLLQDMPANNKGRSHRHTSLPGPLQPPAPPAAAHPGGEAARPGGETADTAQAVADSAAAAGQPQRVVEEGWFKAPQPAAAPEPPRVHPLIEHLRAAIAGRVQGLQELVTPVIKTLVDARARATRTAATPPAQPPDYREPCRYTWHAAAAAAIQDDVDAAVSGITHVLGLLQPKTQLLLSVEASVQSAASFRTPDLLVGGDGLGGDAHTSAQLTPHHLTVRTQRWMDLTPGMSGGWPGASGTPLWSPTTAAALGLEMHTVVEAVEVFCRDTASPQVQVCVTDALNKAAAEGQWDSVCAARVEHVAAEVRRRLLMSLGQPSGQDTRTQSFSSGVRTSQGQRVDQLVCDAGQRMLAWLASACRT